jgi:hypothetical protein
MGKREDLLRAGSANVMASMGAGQRRDLPGGLDPASAVRRPAHL